MTQQQAENAPKWLHTIHFNEKEPFLSNRFKKKKKIIDHRVPTSVFCYVFFFFFFFIITRKFGNYDNNRQKMSQNGYTPKS